MMKWYERVIYFQVMLVIKIGLNMLWAFPLKWAWNYTITYLFNLPKLTWLHSFLLLFVLTSLWKLNITSVIKD